MISCKCDISIDNAVIGRTDVGYGSTPNKRQDPFFSETFLSYFLVCEPLSKEHPSFMFSHFYLIFMVVWKGGFLCVVWVFFFF